jgi:hypothetical protein
MWPLYAIFCETIDQVVLLSLEPDAWRFIDKFPGDKLA